MITIALEINEQDVVIGYHDDLVGATHPYALSDGEDINSVLGKILNGSALVEAPLTELQLIAEGEAIVEAHIYEPIAAYNLQNGTNFGSVHNCANYKDEVNYTHAQFCQIAWDFNVLVWEAARAIQIDIMTGEISQPSKEEFKAMLPAL